MGTNVMDRMEELLRELRGLPEEEDDIDELRSMADDLMQEAANLAGVPEELIFEWTVIKGLK